MMFYTIFLVCLAVLIGGIVMLSHRTVLTVIQTGIRNEQTKKIIAESTDMVKRLTVGMKSMSDLLSRIILIVLLCWVYCKDWHFHVDD